MLNSAGLAPRKGNEGGDATDVTHVTSSASPTNSTTTNPTHPTNSTGSTNPTTLDIYGVVPDSIVDGPGLRYSIFVQGCPHNCPGCHNPESHAYGCGQKMTADELLAQIEGNKLLEGVTFSGGEPFDQALECAELARTLKSRGYDIWAFTGYLYPDLLADDARRELLETVDVLVDGPFVKSLQSYELDWRGSSNQRIIDVPKSLAAGDVVLWEKPTATEYPIPENW